MSDTSVSINDQQVALDPALSAIRTANIEMLGRCDDMQMQAAIFSRLTTKTPLVGDVAVEQPKEKKARKQNPLRRKLTQLLCQPVNKKTSMERAVAELRPTGLLRVAEVDAAKQIRSIVQRYSYQYYQYPDGDIGLVSRVNE